MNKNPTGSEVNRQANPRSSMNLSLNLCASICIKVLRNLQAPPQPPAKMTLIQQGAWDGGAGWGGGEWVLWGFWLRMSKEKWLENPPHVTHLESYWNAESLDWGGVTEWNQNLHLNKIPRCFGCRAWEAPFQSKGQQFSCGGPTRK